MGSDSKINLMHTVLSLETGGLERMVAESALAIDKKLFKVDICCFDRLGDFADKLESNGVGVTLLPRNQYQYDYLFPIKLKKLLIENKTHIIHMHTGTFFLGTQASILARTPARIYTEHGRKLVEPKKHLLMDRASAIFVDKIVAVSKELEDFLVSVVKIPHKKTMTIINGIDTNKYTFRAKPLALLKEFGIAENAKVVGTVGRLAEVKDQVSLIEAFSIVNHKFPDSILMLVGDGPMRSALQELVMAKGLDDNVIFAGNRMDVHELLNLLDVFLLTSLSEGTSVALLEAMASGIPSVITDVGGNPSVVTNGINGLLVKPKDVARIADSIFYILNNEAASILIGQNAANTVKADYSIEIMLKNYTELYRGLIKYQFEELIA